ncbi:hypothetical protein CMU71_05800 [Elizabethkingia anophelis]|uniref:hypothetical protein n=1 Tax=Elizabethkingia anophelis TaxID=1117645 RepID=UPI00099A3CB4|nr:hypothetical protein [Elizabethkingia anophelis]MDV3566409.1 hypothetical protein [Elizabethkingia anophelis]MDV3970884.1 hypothetical protein [Elizabethkingia anophelis]OPC41293.1 hypothetical protein BAY02_05570 [Elizabethkingia anophelis]QRI49956.1 hypothetical protein JQC76_00155 [Elizabethkingia anophelis]
MDINKSFEESIKSTELYNIASDIGEALIDSTLEDGILKDIPIIGTIINLGKGYLSIQDRIFSKKILKFLFQLKDIPESERIKAIKRIDESQEEKIKVGERLLYLIERADDHIKSEYIGKLFAEYVKENLGYEEFKRCSEIINKSFLDDLIWFLESDVKTLTMEESSELISSGIFDMPYSLEIKNEGNTDISIGDKYVVKGFEKVSVNYFANKMRNLLR